MTSPGDWGRDHEWGSRVGRREEGSWPIHSRVRYEWSGDTVRGVTVDCTTITAGSVWQLRARPREGGGGIVDVHFDFQPKGPGLVVWAVISLLGRGLLEKHFQRTINILETEQRADNSALSDPSKSVEDRPDFFGDRT